MRKPEQDHTGLVWHGRTYHNLSYHIITSHIISYHIISYHIISYHIISYHIIADYIITITVEQTQMRRLPALRADATPVAPQHRRAPPRLRAKER